MKKTFILNVFVAVATALGTMLLMTSCQHSDDEKEVHFQLKEHEVEVPADESNVQIAYELSAHASAADIKCTCNEQWVNNFDASQPGVIVFHVEKNMENVQREAKIEMTCGTANKQTLTVRQGARKPDFEISYQVNSSEIIMDITPAYEDSTYIFSLYDREKVPTDEDVEKEFRTEIDHLLNTTSQMGLTAEEALAQLVAKKPHPDFIHILERKYRICGIRIVYRHQNWTVLVQTCCSVCKNGKGQTVRQQTFHRGVGHKSAQGNRSFHHNFQRPIRICVFEMGKLEDLQRRRNTQHPHGIFL